MKVIWGMLTKEELDSSFVSLKGKLGKVKEELNEIPVERVDIPDVLTRRYLYSKKVKEDYALGEYMYDAENSIIMGYVDEGDLPIIFEDFEQSSNSNSSFMEMETEVLEEDDEEKETPWEDDSINSDSLNSYGEEEQLSNDIDTDFEEDDEEIPWEDEEEETPWEEESEELEGMYEEEEEDDLTYGVEEDDEDEEEPWVEGLEEEGSSFEEEIDEDEEEQWIEEDNSDSNGLVEDVVELQFDTKPNEEVKVEVPNKVSLNLTMEDDNVSLDFINKIVNKEETNVTLEEENTYKEEEKVEDEKLKNLPVNPIEFLRRYPRSTETEVKKYYSSNEVDKYIDRGLIQKVRGKLFI